MYRIVSLGAALLAIAGCATSSIPLSEARPVPADEIYAFAGKGASDTARLTVFRDAGFVGSGCDVVFYIDGQRAAKIGPGQKASFDVPSGEVNLGTGLAESGLCSGAAIKTMPATLKAGKTSTYRISGDMQGFYLGPYVEYDH